MAIESLTQIKNAFVMFISILFNAISESIIPLKVYIRKTLYSLVLAVLFCTTNAQDRTNYMRTDLISPSPTASSFTRYGNISVNPSSGAANLSIPVFNVQGMELSMPISLSYGYSGLRSAENAGWAGLGWTLQAGGVITCNIRGKVDNASDPSGFSSTYVSDKIYNGLNNSQSADFQTFLENVLKGNYDTEPDIYSFNFPGHSGKFIIYKGQAYCYPDQKLKIGDQGGSFIITTEDGTRYIFAATETTRSKANANAQYNLPVYTSAYYLSQIQNAAQTESINLSYVQEAEITQIGPLTQSYKKYATYEDQSILFDPVNSYPTFVRPLRLTEITSEKFRVSFTAEASPRLDLQGVNYALGGIAVNDLDVSKEIKYFKFNHGYFGSNAYLKLLSLEEFNRVDLNQNAAPSQVHTFEYEEASGFPIKPTLGADHYGYYNGGSSSILIPDYIYPSGPNRNPNPLFAKQGALKKITYPTGGYTVFTYEGNVTYDGRNYKKKENGATAQAFISGSASVPFVLENAQEVRVDLDRYPLTISGDGNIRGDDDFKIYNISTGEMVMFGRIVSEDANLPFYQMLPAGSYRLTAFADRYENEVRATINYTRVTELPIEGKLVGGVRVAMIKDFPLIGTSTTKEYEYTDADGFSTGSSSSDPIYSQNGTTEIIDEPTGYRVRYATTYSSSISEIDYTGIQHFYSSVEESNTSANVKTVTRSDYGINDYFCAQPFLIRTTAFKTLPSGQLQLVKRKVINYRTVTGNGIISIRPFQTLDASLTGVGPSWGYTGPVKEFAPNVVQYDQGWEYIFKSSDTDFLGADSVKNEVTNIYDLDKKNLQMVRMKSSNGSTLVTKYKYANNYTSSLSAGSVAANVISPVWEEQLWRKNTSDSVLLTSKVTLFNSQFRPTDVYTMELAGISALNNELQSAGLFTTIMSDTRLVPKVRFNYDAQGHLVQQKKEAGASISYKWGYGSNKKHYLIAEAKNATDTEFFTENFEDITNESQGLAHTGIRFHSGAYTVNWNIPNSKTYLIGYYYLSSSGWKYKTESFINAGHPLSGGSAYDDIRVFPSNAEVTTYTYLTGIGVSSIIDAKGQTQYYEYDKVNRLAYIKNNNGDILKSFNYNTRTADGKFYNIEISAGFSRNNCSGSLSGSRVYFTIPAGSYVSSVSQADADGQATAAINAGGQAYANANGTCGDNVNITSVNTTQPITPGGVKSGYIELAQFKNITTGIVYSFTAQQINGGINLPKGTYNIEFQITGSKYNEIINLGWSSLSLISGTTENLLGFYSDHYMKNVNLNLGAATLLLSGENSLIPL